MDAEIQINDSVSPRARYVGWTPAVCRIRVTNPDGVAAPFVSLRIGSRSVAGDGRVRFRGRAADPFAAPTG